MFVTSADAVRALPLYTGIIGVAGLAVNRIALFLHPAVPTEGGNAGRLLALAAEGSQTRADVLCLLCAASLVFTGLSWRAIAARTPEPVEPCGDDCLAFASDLPDVARRELEWAWRASASATKCVSMAVFYRGRCVMQAGVRAPASRAGPAESPDELSAAVDGVPAEEITGPLVAKAMKTGNGNFLANLILFPGRDEFFPYLPANTKACSCTRSATRVCSSRAPTCSAAAGSTKRGFATSRTSSTPRSPRRERAKRVAEVMSTYFVQIARVASSSSAALPNMCAPAHHCAHT